MGTPAIIIIQQKQEDGTIVVKFALYARFDGHPDYSGVSLFTLFTYFTPKNLSALETVLPRVIQNTWEAIPLTDIKGSADYYYTLTFDQNLALSVEVSGHAKFVGTAQDALNWCNGC